MTTYDFEKELIQNVKPRFSYNGGDFSSWQSAARTKLAKLIGLDKFSLVDPKLQIEYDKQLENFREIRFTFKSEENYRVPCHLLLPNGIEKPPVMICLQGHSNGMHISIGVAKFESDENTIKGGDRDFCLRAVKEGFAAIALEQRNFGELSCNNSAPQCFESSMTALLMGRTTVGERVWDIMRLIDVIEQNFKGYVDINTICCMGNSGGGTATAYTTAIEDRIVLAMPSCAMCTYKDSIGAMNHCACNYVPNITNYFDMNDLLSMAYPKFFIQVNGIKDDIFPISAAEQVFEKGKKIYDDMGDGYKCHLIKGDGGHRFYADDSWPIVHKMLKR